MKIAVSSCLLGICCKYNGKSNYNKEICDLQKKHQLIPICPEVLGGLSTPRIPSEIIKDQVINQDGDNVTNNYILGANKAYQILKDNNVEVAILKSKSPSCGYGEIYDGTFSHSLIQGNGITSQFFLERNIKIYNENNFKDLFK